MKTKELPQNFIPAPASGAKHAANPLQFKAAKSKIDDKEKKAKEEQDPLGKGSRFNPMEVLAISSILQRKPMAAQLQVKPEEEEEPLQMKVNPLQKADNAAAPERKNGLPHNLKAGVEGLSGIAMDDVQVHYNSDKPAQLNALAYAQGSDIHIGPGQEKHLPHEAWHIVQQKQDRVEPTFQMKEGVPINDDKGLENEADVMGGKAMQMNG